MGEWLLSDAAACFSCVFTCRVAKRYGFNALGSFSVQLLYLTLLVKVVPTYVDIFGSVFMTMGLV